MKITRDVITDLLPVYLSGEASADTRALVENFFKEDPEFAKLAKADWSLALTQAIPGTLSQEDEMAALARARAAVRRRSLFLAFALMFTGFLAGFYFDRSGVHWIWRDFSGGAVACGVLALICWISFFMIKHPLRASTHSPRRLHK